jgi:hypothetical protein
MTCVDVLHWLAFNKKCRQIILFFLYEFLSQPKMMNYSLLGKIALVERHQPKNKIEATYKGPPFLPLCLLHMRVSFALGNIKSAST